MKKLARFLIRAVIILCAGLVISCNGEGDNDDTNDDVSDDDTDDDIDDDTDDDVAALDVFNVSSGGNLIGIGNFSMLSCFGQLSPAGEVQAGSLALQSGFIYVVDTNVGYERQRKQFLKKLRYICDTRGISDISPHS